jgi:hypothetical protein
MKMEDYDQSSRQEGEDAWLLLLTLQAREEEGNPIDDDGLKLDTILSEGGVEYLDCLALFDPSRRN